MPSKTIITRWFNIRICHLNVDILTKNYNRQIFSRLIKQPPTKEVFHASLLLWPPWKSLNPAFQTIDKESLAFCAFDRKPIKPLVLRDACIFAGQQPRLPNPAQPFAIYGAPLASTLPNNASFLLSSRYFATARSCRLFVKNKRPIR